MSESDLREALQNAADHGNCVIKEVGGRQTYQPLSVHAYHLAQKLDQLDPGSLAVAVDPKIKEMAVQKQARHSILASAAAAVGGKLYVPPKEKPHWHKSKNRRPNGRGNSRTTR